MGDNKQCYIEGYAVERAGKSSTKISFIRIPISEQNRLDIKENFNMEFNTLFLLISFGDFKNEGISEYNYYSELYSDITKHAEDLSTIINIFKNDFTSETRELAMELINNGFKITEELTSDIRNREY